MQLKVNKKKPNTEKCKYTWIDIDSYSTTMQTMKPVCKSLSKNVNVLRDGRYTSTCIHI